MDPWLSPEGAFEAAWFQFPRNHHLAPLVLERLQDSTKERFVYISHEHQDHFDRSFLSRLNCRDLTFIVPRFQRAALRTALADYHPKRVIACEHGQTVQIPGGQVTMYLEESGLNRDSAVLIKADGKSFLNLNDCKLYDELPGIVEREGAISIFACQFSGATWHPICYDYPSDEYERISQQKIASKFETVARAIEIVKPEIYFPSAGPACFLDPMLMHLNFERTNVFPRAPKFLAYLNQRLAGSSTRALDIVPGDIFDANSGEFVTRHVERNSENEIEKYLGSYAGQYASWFAERQREPLREGLGTLLERLRVELEHKLSSFFLYDRVRVPLYIGFSDVNAPILRIDFGKRSVVEVPCISDHNYYSLKAPAWQLARILDGRITWEDFALTFRMRLNRSPDVYQTLIQGFLLMEPEDMNWFCGRVLEIEQRGKRTIVEAGGTRYSIDRYCPHGGADLSQGWSDEGRFWICPRHRWQFALDRDGQCLTSNTSIHAVCLECDP
jgi:UDP-MurNAc hydroxylase